MYDLEPNYRHGPAVPEGKGMILNGQKIQPTNGPQGYGLYAPTNDPQVVDFYPVYRQSSQAPNRVTTTMPMPMPQEVFQTLPSSRAPHAQPGGQGYVPHDSQQPSQGPQVPMDPRFVELFAQFMMVQREQLGSAEDQDELWQTVIDPMMNYFQSSPDPMAGAVYQQLISKCAELGVKPS